MSGHNSARNYLIDDRAIYPMLAAFLIVAILAGTHPIFYENFGIRWAFDQHDIGVYLASSRWVVEGGALYRDVPSEYPLFANIIFAAVRYSADLVYPRVRGFYILWMALAWLAYLYALYRVSNDTMTLAVLAWLSPAVIYFALLRYDIYPAMATLLALFAIRREAYVKGALWLGVAIALKGYALFLLPTFGVFLLQKRGILVAVGICITASVPMLLSLLAIMVFAGWEGVLAPFRFHSVRTLNGESTYDAINYLFAASLVSDGPWTSRVANILQIACALVAAGMLPRSFDDLINAFLFAILGFVTFSVFYSPQFVLWIVPLVCFSSSRRMLISGIFLSWITYIYFPVAHDLGDQGYTGLLKVAVVAVAALRIWMMLLAAHQRWGPIFNRRHITTPR